MKISQREARRLRRRVEELERRENTNNSAWCHEYPGGVHIDTIKVTNTELHIIQTARLLGKAVVVKPSTTVADTLLVYACRP